MFLIFLLMIGCTINRTDELVQQAKLRQAFMEKPDWVVVKSISPGDTQNVLKIKYKCDSTGTAESTYCMVVFKNNNTGDYRCVAPWMEKTLDLKETQIYDSLELVSKNCMFDKKLF